MTHITVTAKKKDMDFSNVFGATFREVGETTRDDLPMPAGDTRTFPEGGLPVRVISGTRLYSDIAIDDLWDALTDGERIGRWFLPISGDLKVGGRYQLEGNASGQITRCDAPFALDVTWEYGGGLSWIAVRLVKEANGVRLTLEHTSPKVEEAEAHWQQFGPGATGVGWDLAFWGLDVYVQAGGENIDRDAMMAWMGSEDGLSFMRDSAAAWGEAHIASGESPDIANNMAQETAKFYTGG